VAGAVRIHLGFALRNRLLIFHVFLLCCYSRGYASILLKRFLNFAQHINTVNIIYIQKKKASTRTRRSFKSLGARTRRTQLEGHQCALLFTRTSRDARLQSVLSNSPHSRGLPSEWVMPQRPALERSSHYRHKLGSEFS
jgi:hypothetical protein